MRLLALSLLLATLAIACAGTSPRATAPAAGPRATRYKLDATPAPAGILQGTLEVRGQRVVMVLDIDRTEQRFTGEIVHADVTRLSFDDGSAFDCTADGALLACAARTRHGFFGRSPLRFEQLTLAVHSL